MSINPQISINNNQALAKSSGISASTSNTQTYLTNSVNNLNTLASNNNNNNFKEAFKSSTNSMNRVIANNNNNETMMDSDIYQSNSSRLSPISKQQQYQNANLEWTKLIQTATKAFESKC